MSSKAIPSSYHFLFFTLLILQGCIDEIESPAQLPPLEMQNSPQVDQGIPINPEVPDCQGVYGGMAREDQCGVCDADPNNDCIQDCRGVWGGQTPWDECNDDAFVPTSNEDQGVLDQAFAIDMGSLSPIDMAMSPFIDQEVPLVDAFIEDQELPILDQSLPIEEDLDLPIEDMMLPLFDQNLPPEDQGQERDCFGVLNGTGELDLCGFCVDRIEDRCERTWSANGDEGFESGNEDTPLSCVNDVVDNGEQGVDCGGPCAPCNQMQISLLATALARSYDTTVFPTQYVMRSIEQLKINGNQAYIHYGFATTLNPDLIAGYDSREVSFTYQVQSQTVSIISWGGFESGLGFAPFHCSDGQLSGSETEVDCGGVCTPCRQLNEAKIAMSIKTFYDLEGPWANRYLVHSIPWMVWQETGVSALYGYSDVGTPNLLEGYDSRIFTR